MSRRGFALPLALAVMVGASIMAVTGLQVALADFHANRGTRLAAKALFASEAGAEHTVARWGSGPWSTLAPGDSAATGWVALPDRSQYRSVVRRVDDGTGMTTLYRVTTTGRPSRASTARRRIVTIVTGGGDPGLCCDAAVNIRGSFRVRAPPRPRGYRGRWDPPPGVDGRDHIPTSWAGYCPVADPPLTGVRIERAADLGLTGGAVVDGSPPVTADGSIDASIADVLGSTTYDELAAQADLLITRNTRYRTQLRPSAAGGVCDTSDPLNWGAPETPGSACWGYLPIIHARGNLRILGGGQGQGILLVDGDLTVNSDFRFYGVVVVKGQAVWRQSGVLTGGLIVRNRASGRGTSMVRDNAVVRYASCAIARASAGLGGAAFLAGRHWFEVE